MSENALSSSAREFLFGGRDILRGLGLTFWGWMRSVDAIALFTGIVVSNLISLVLFTCGAGLRLPKQTRKVGERIIKLSEIICKAAFKDPWIARVYGYPALAAGVIYLAKRHN